MDMTSIDVASINVFLKIFFFAIIGDFVTGIVSAAKRGKLKSRECSDGIFRSIGECVVLFSFLVVDYFFSGIDTILTTFIVAFIFKEVLSIIENLIEIDVWIPDTLKKMFEVGIESMNKGDSK